MKRFYNLDELAQKWSLSVAEILFMAAEGKVVLSIAWKGPGFLNDGSRDSDWSMIDEFVDIHGSDIDLLLSESVKFVAFDTVYRRDGTKVRLSQDREPVGPPIRPQLYIIDLLAVLRQEVERVEAEHNISFSDETKDTTKETEEPKVTRAEIARYLDVSVSTVKNHMKKKGFPFRKKTNGLVEAYPSELDKWSRRKNK